MILLMAISSILTFYETIKVDAIKELLIEKGIFTNTEFDTKMYQAVSEQNKQMREPGSQSGTELEY